MHRHYIKRNDTTRTPARILFVGTNDDISPIDHKSGKHYAKLTSGYVVTTKYRKGRLTSCNGGMVLKATEFWDLVYRNMSSRNVLWIMGFDLGRSMTLLGLWREMEWKRLLLVAPPLHLKKDRDTTKPPRLRSGYITDDGGQFRGKLYSLDKGTLKFADLAGYTTLSPRECWDNLHERNKEIADYTNDKASATDAASFNAWTAHFTVSKLIADHAENDVGNWTPTAAGIAWHNWRHKHMSELVATHDDVVARYLEWNLMYGGISEPRFIGLVAHKDLDLEHSDQFHEGHNGGRIETLVHAYDINSAYPFSSLGMGLPTRHVASYGRITVHELNSLCNLWSVAATVLIASTERQYPVRYNGQLHYACGHYWTCLCGDELTMALEHGDVQEVGCAACWRSGMPLDAYMKHWYSMKMVCRKHGDKIGADHIKQMMNGLIGKFAQKCGRWQNADDIVPTKPWGQWPLFDAKKETLNVARSLGFQVQARVGKDFMADACPIITETIHANQRASLRRMILDIGPRNVLYIDTDMIHVTDNGRKQMLEKGYVDDNQFGSWKYKGTAAIVLYRGRQNYNWDGKDVISGVPLSGIMLMPGMHDVRMSETTKGVINRMPDGTVKSWREVIDMRDGKYQGMLCQDGYLLPPMIDDPAFPDDLIPNVVK